MTVAIQTLRDRLPDDLALEEPDIVGSLAVFPVTGSPGPHRYLSLAAGTAAGVTVGELPTASVNDLVVDNPLDTPVLLYEGEEVLGAQQNRTVDHAVLLAPASKTVVGVSCVERNRWDGDRHVEHFQPSPQTAFPELRRHKSRRMRERLAREMEARADQQEVWRLVDSRDEQMAVDSATGAMSDLYADRDEDIDRLKRCIRRRDGQLGSLVLIGGRVVVLDLVSRPEVYADLHGPLTAGYALDALERTVPDLPVAESAHRWFDRALDQPTRPSRVPGIADGLVMDSPPLGGTGLAIDDHAVQLCLYAAEPGAQRTPHIRRPSRRR